MNIYRLFTCLVLTLVIISCSNKEKTTTILVKNTLDIQRSFETVELTKTFLNVEDITVIGIRDVDTGQLQITQTVDNDNDGILDDILFQPQVAPNSTKKFEIITITEAEKPEVEDLCYSRFVPERTDDYAWENDKVAFRVFGPNAQYRFENNLEEGTLSSGIDAWLKKVDYPIINSWYKKYSEKTGSYHEDTGEGLDNFHVGISRGVGGLAVKKDSIFYYSKNFSKWRTITTGPIRTSFYLEYETWTADDKTIKESKIISLDLGSNLSKFTVSLEGTNSIYAGLTLHEKDGAITKNSEKNWVSYWQPHGGSELGTAIITTKDALLGFEEYDVATKDLSHAYAHLKTKNNKVTYYSGFTWKESEQFKNKQAWETYLDTYSKKIQNPLKVKFIK